MADFKGFGELQKPEDLVRKLEHDLGRVRNSPQDQYAAFDFFVTAEHIIDWLHPDDRAAREATRASYPLLRITSHIANGAKHFEAKNKHHRSVSGVEKERYVERGYVEEGYFAEPLIVHLTPDEGKEIGHDPSRRSGLRNRSTNTGKPMQSRHNHRLQATHKSASPSSFLQAAGAALLCATEPKR